MEKLNGIEIKEEVEASDKDTLEAIKNSLTSASRSSIMMPKGETYEVVQGLTYGEVFTGKNGAYIVVKSTQSSDKRIFTIGTAFRSLWNDEGASSVKVANDGTFIDLVKRMAQEFIGSDLEKMDGATLNKINGLVLGKTFKVKRAEKLSYTISGETKRGYFYTLDLA